MGYRSRRRKPSVVRNGRLSYGTSGNGEWFQAHVVRELKAIRSEAQGFQSHVIRELNELHGETRALRGETRAIRREQDRINERLLLLITKVSDGVAKLNRRMDRQDVRNTRQDRVNGLVFKEFKRLRRRTERQDRRNVRQDRINHLILREVRRLHRRKSP